MAFVGYYMKEVAGISQNDASETRKLSIVEGKGITFELDQRRLGIGFFGSELSFNGE